MGDTHFSSVDSTSGYKVGGTTVIDSNGNLVAAVTLSGNVDLGDTAADTVTVNGEVDSDISFEESANRALKIAAEATANATAAKNLTISASNKTAGTGNGGNLVLNAGTSSGGTAGTITVGTNGSAVTITPACTITGALTLSGGIASLVGNLVFSNAANRSLNLSDDSAADATAAKNLTIAAANKTAGTGNGGNLVLNAGTSSGGTAGTITIGTNGSTVTITPNTTISGTLNVVGALTKNGNQVQAAGDEFTGRRIPFQLSQLDYTTDSTLGTLTRNAQGDYSINRTAGGAENHYFSGVVPYKIETAGKGAKLTAIQVAYELGVADATSVDLRVDSTVFAQATEPAVTNNHGGTIVDGDYDANHDTAAKRADKDVTGGEHLMTLTLNTPAYYVTANGVVRFEFQAVLANTGTLKVRQVILVYSDTQF